MGRSLFARASQTLDISQKALSCRGSGGPYRGEWLMPCPCGGLLYAAQVISAKWSQPKDLSQAISAKCCQPNDPIQEISGQWSQPTDRRQV